MLLNSNKIHELVRLAEQDYVNGTSQTSKYVEFGLCENIAKIDAYLNSRHTSGLTDSMGREKPFFNIVTAAVNIWFRATDIDRKNIRLKATQASQYVLAFIATLLLQEWMKKNAFGAFLNEWGRTLARYGSAVVKFVEKEGELYSEVIPWNRLIVDAVDFEANPKIEKLWLTPAQLKKNKGYDQELVQKLIEATTVRKTLDGQNKDTKSDYIPIYEVHGELPLSYLTGEADDEDEFVQQMHVISFVANKDKRGFDEFTLYSGREKQDPYLITHLIKEDGRSQAIGAVEHLFDAQWMVNHTVKQIKDQLDLASKLIFQTSDPNFVGRNVLTAIESGDILTHRLNEPLTQIANNSHDITSLQNFGAQWMNLSKEITATPEAMRGETMPSGTAYRQVALLQQEAHSLFEIMTENKGLALETMMRVYIIPYLKKQMDSTEEIAAILEDHQIAQLDSLFVPNEAIKRVNEKIKNTVLSGQIYDPAQQGMDMATEAQGIQSQLSVFGNQRFIRPSEISSVTWKKALKDFEWEVEVEVTNESVDKEAVMTTLSTVMQTVAQNPGVLQDPNMRMLFNKILEETGKLSPIELNAPKMMPAPQSVGSVAGTNAQGTQANEIIR